MAAHVIIKMDRLSEAFYRALHEIIDELTKPSVDRLAILKNLRQIEMSRYHYVKLMRSSQYQQRVRRSSYQDRRSLHYDTENI